MFEALGQEFIKTYDSRIKPEHKEIVQRLMASYESYQSDASKLGPMGVVRTSFRIGVHGLDGRDGGLTVTLFGDACRDHRTYYLNMHALKGR
jgi:hypothetical protein